MRALLNRIYQPEYELVGQQRACAARAPALGVIKFSTVELIKGNWCITPARQPRAGFRKFSRKKKSCIARAGRARVGLTVYSPWIQIREVAASIARPNHRKSKFELRHAIKLNLLYWVTKSKFGFSMIPPSYRRRRVFSHYAECPCTYNLGRKMAVVPARASLS
jgi:hypothetical protein